jgi:hypothetical protein
MFCFCPRISVALFRCLYCIYLQAKIWINSSNTQPARARQTSTRAWFHISRRAGIYTRKQLEINRLLKLTILVGEYSSSMFQLSRVLLRYSWNDQLRPPSTTIWFTILYVLFILILIFIYLISTNKTEDQGPISVP